MEAEPVSDVTVPLLVADPVGNSLVPLVEGPTTVESVALDPGPVSVAVPEDTVIPSTEDVALEAGVVSE